MKNISFSRIALLALALGTASATATFAQTTPTTTTPATTTAPAIGKHHGESILTADERAELKKARDAAFAANPDLKTEHDSLKQKFAAAKSQGDKADKKALKAEKVAFKQKLDAAMLAADPTVGPILTKLEAAHQGHHHDAGA